MRTLLLFAALGALFAAPVAAGAGADVRSVSGHITSHQVTEGCTSPVGLCTAGRMTGTIHGDFEFVATRIAGPSDVPGVLFFTGKIAVHSNQGDFFCTDATVFDAASPDGEFVDLCNATGGTGRWAGATGYLQIVGTFTADGGSSDYVGKIGTP